MNIANIGENELSDIFNQHQSKTTHTPHNNEMEQSLLAAILINNNVLEKIDERLQSAHFYAPIHQDIFQQIVNLRTKGVAFTHLNIDADKKYLIDLLMYAANHVIHPLDNSQIIVDLYIKRKIIEVAEQSIVELKSNTTISAIEQLSSIEQKLFEISKIDDTVSNVSTFEQATKIALDVAQLAYQADGSLVGLSTSFASIDNLLGGLQNSDLLILAGRPSMGKTALATNIAYNVAKNLIKNQTNQSVLFFSLEMSRQQIANRIIASEADINSQDILRGNLTKQEIEHLIFTGNQNKNTPMIIDDTPALNIATMRNRARRLQRQHNVALIVIDYLQLLTTSVKNRGFNRVQEVSEISQGLKALAKELDVPVIALSQLSRGVESREDKRPQLSDLRDSGSIEQDADVVMFVYREQYYLERSEPDADSDKYAKWHQQYEKTKGKAEVIIAKQRHGAIGSVEMNFNGSRASFSD